jgi:hypothetical protein
MDDLNDGYISNTPLRNLLMPIEFFQSIIAAGFVAVWLMVGQFSTGKHPSTMRR